MKTMIQDRLLIETVVGSQAYGLARPGSDLDLKGIFVEPMSELLTLKELPAQISEDRNNRVYYSLRRYLSLVQQANPTVLEVLYTPEDCIRHLHPAFQQVIDQRDQFLTLKAYDSHVRYAEAQIRKAKGRNKWINQPQPQEPPDLLDFCWFISRTSGNSPHELPFRPKPLRDSGLDLGLCKASALEHAPNFYRIYKYGKATDCGVIHGGKIFCQSIPLEDEDQKCIGLLVFNEEEYRRAKRDHYNYWEWRRNRNESRWVDQESGRLDYDAKNMAHMFRLMYSAQNILSHNKPLVRFVGVKQKFLLSVLNGEHEYDDLMQMAKKLKTDIDEAYQCSDLPESSDPSVAEDLLRKVTLQWEQSAME